MSAAQHTACIVARRLHGASYFTPFPIGRRWFYVAPAIPAEHQPETVFGPFDNEGRACWDSTSCETQW
jgi:hypothetical protein